MTIATQFQRVPGSIDGARLAIKWLRTVDHLRQPACPIQDAGATTRVAAARLRDRYYRTYRLVYGVETWYSRPVIQGVDTFRLANED